MSETTETSFHKDDQPKPQAPTQATDEGGVSIQGQAKQLCVNKAGHTMVAPLENEPNSFLDLFRRHRLKTISYCAVFWSFGICVAFLGPTLLDLECRLASMFSAMSWVFFSQSLFLLIGCACGGFIVQKLNNNLVLLVSAIMISVTLALIPACSVLATLALVLAVMGFFMGIIDTVTNISMIELYGRNVAPFLQALHFCYGLGAFVSPMIAEPFLLNKDCSQLVMRVLRPRNKIEASRNITDALAISEAQHHSKIHYAFWILAAMQLPVILLIISLVIRDVAEYGRSLKNPTEPQNSINTEDLEMKGPVASDSKLGVKTTCHGHTEDPSKVSKKHIYLVTALTTAILFLSEGLQAGFGGYLFSYAVKSISGMSTNEAAYLNACFWGTFAFGRLISIGIATKLEPPVMLICNIIGCMFAMALMLLFRHNHIVIYLGTMIFGTFMSSIFPTAITLAETYIDVTSFITSILVGGASLGEMVLPVAIGHEFDSIGPVSLLISGVIVTVVSLIIYIALYTIGEGFIASPTEISFAGRINGLFRPSSKEVKEDSGLLEHNVSSYKRMASELSESDLQASKQSNGSSLQPQ